MYHFLTRTKELKAFFLGLGKYTSSEIFTSAGELKRSTWYARRPDEDVIRNTPFMATPRGFRGAVQACPVDFGLCGLCLYSIVKSKVCHLQRLGFCVGTTVSFSFSSYEL